MCIVREAIEQMTAPLPTFVSYAAFVSLCHSQWGKEHMTKNNYWLTGIEIDGITYCTIPELDPCSEIDEANAFRIIIELLAKYPTITAERIEKLRSLK